MRALLVPLALLALPACFSPEVQSWHPAYAGANTAQIAETAIEIGEDDVAQLESAGGRLHGTITINHDTGTSAAEGAAYFGGTHFMTVGESHAVTAHGWHSESHTIGRYRLWRVPAAKWGKLPRVLRPKPR